MSISEARKLLWKRWESMSEKEIQRCIDYIGALCSYVIEQHLKEKSEWKVS